MAYPRPSLVELQKRIYTDIVSNAGIKSLLKRSIIRAISYALAGVVHLLFGFIDFVYKEAFPTTCSEAVLYIWAYIFNVPRKNASFSKRRVKFLGANGSYIDQGTILRMDEVEFIVQEGGYITGGFYSPMVECSLAGVNGNIETGAELSLAQPIAGVQPKIEVLEADAIDGEDIEDVELWRSRLIEKIQNTPHGGSLPDYEMWAKQIPGVTRAWPYENYTGLGFVGLAFVLDGALDIFPDSAKVNEVQTILNSLRPVTANLVVFSPVKQEIDFTIQLNPNTPAVQDAVTESLKDLFKREASPGGTVYISRIREAISLATGEDDHVLVSPTANIVSPTGNLAVLGTVTFGNIT